MTSDPPPTRALQENECWALLRETAVGRLAVCEDGRPDIFPVDLVVDHGTIVFRSGGGDHIDRR